jgi:osmotically-inducible protein OsmY
MKYKKIDDEKLRDLVKKRLEAHPILKDENIYVDVIDQQVILSGVIDDLSMKWLTEDVVADLMGVLSIENRIEVRQEKYSDPTSFYVE